MYKVSMWRSAFIAVACSISCMAGADTQARPLDIPAGDLIVALAELAKQSGVEFVYRADLLEGVHTRGVSGNLSPQEAVTKLLEGTSLILHTDEATGAMRISPACSSGTTRISGDASAASTRLEESRRDSSGRPIRLAAGQANESGAEEAGQSGSPQGMLEEIVVTAEKTQRSLRQTATSVSALNAAEIERRAAFMGNDLLKEIPNVTTSEPSNYAPAVRGLNGTGAASGAGAFIAGTRPRLGYQVDGRSLSYNEAIFSDSSLWDVSQVEVYRGPQSTLQGRNAIAGIVALRTNEPTFDWEGKVRAIAGDQHTRQASGVLSGPLVDDMLAFRVSADVRTSLSPIETEPFTGESKPGKYRSESVRARLLIAPASMPTMKTLVTLSHVDAYAPQGTLAARPFGNYRGEFSDPPLPGRNARFQTRANTAIVDTSWGLSDTITLQGLVTATDLKVNRYTDPGRGIARIDAKEYSFEPRLRATLLDGRLKGFIGAFVFRNDQDEALDLLGGLTFKDSTDTNAVFGDATLALTSAVDLNLAARYEYEKRNRVGGNPPFFIDYDETFKEFMPKVTLSWKVDEAWTVGAVAGKGYNGGAAGFTFFPPFVSYTFEPEHVWNYELFARAALLDNRLALSANVFFNDYSDLQLPFDLNPDPEILANVIRNADQVEVYGAELSARFAPVRQFEMSLDVGLLHSKVTKNPGSGIEGNELERSPGFNARVGLAYRPTEAFELSVGGFYSDSYNSDVFPPLGKVDSYFVADAQASYRFGKARLFVSVDNLFDEVIPVYLFQDEVDPANDAAVLMEPRTVMAGIEYRF